MVVVTQTQVRVLVELLEAEEAGRRVYVAEGSLRSDRGLVTIGVDMATALVADGLARAPGIVLRLTPEGEELARAHRVGRPRR